MTRQQSKRLVKLLVLLVILTAGFIANKQPLPPDVLGTVSPGYYRVVRVDDGDTIQVDMDGQIEKVRFVGVDTPETQDPRKPVQCFGKAASEFTRNLIGSNPVRLESDEMSQNRDRYNRLLRYVYLPDGRLLQEEIIREGYGFAYTNFPFTKSAVFKQLETEARTASRGLWGNCQPNLTEYGTYTSNPE